MQVRELLQKAFQASLESALEEGIQDPAELAARIVRDLEPPSDDTELIRLRDAAELAGFHRPVLVRWVTQGRFPVELRLHTEYANLVTYLRRSTFEELQQGVYHRGSGRRRGKSDVET